MLRISSNKFIFSFLLFFFCLTLNAQDNNSRPKVGLVLSGGGAKGFAHIGVIRVLEEQGIPIDYISGTSMGAIIGGLYAMGYSPDDLQKIIIKQDWSNVLTDAVDRKYVPLDDRDEFDRYAFSLAITKDGISLPQGMIAGQNIMKIISRYTIPFHTVNDFSKFPIPFACVASDVVDGKEYVMTKGDIAVALRASMSLPTVFSPVVIDNKLLIDGGMRNNFPADVVKNMGADIIIGVDLQEENKEIDGLGQMSSIFNQSISYLGLPKYNANLKLVDIYMKPNLGQYSIIDFNSADSLINIGYRTAQKFVPRLDSLKHKLGLCRVVQKTLKPIQLNDSLYVDTITVSGRKLISKSSILGKFNISSKSKSTIGEIEEGVNRLYASLGLKSVVYSFGGKNGSELHLDVVEKNENRFNVGVHYDSWNNAALLLNTTYSNLLGKSSKLSLDLKLAQNPAFAVTYSHNRGWKPGVRLRLEYTGYDFIELDNNMVRSKYGANAYRFDINTNSIISESYSFGVGARAEYYNFKVDAGVGDLKRDHYYVNYYSFLRMDTHERLSYPRTGMSLYAECRAMTDNGYSMGGGTPLLMMYFKMKKPIPINSSLTLIPYLYFNGPVNRRDEDMLASKTYWGGVVETSYFYNQIPFVGLKEMGAAYNSSFVGRLDLQWEIWKNKFLILKWNVGKSSSFFDYNAIIHGGALTYGMDTPIGPFEVSVMGNSAEDGVDFLFNIGYWF